MVTFRRTANTVGGTVSQTGWVLDNKAGMRWTSGGGLCQPQLAYCSANIPEPPFWPPSSLPSELVKGKHNAKSFRRGGGYWGEVNLGWKPVLLWAQRGRPRCTLCCPGWRSLTHQARWTEPGWRPKRPHGGRHPDILTPILCQKYDVNHGFSE